MAYLRGMKLHSLIVAAMIFSVSASAQQPEFDKLLEFMSGSFTSEQQAKEDSTYLHITLDMVPVFPRSEEGRWLYVEQAAAVRPEKPYRQRLYHLQQLDDSTFASTIYALKEPDEYVGASTAPGKLFGMDIGKVAKEVVGCAVTLKLRKDQFIGSTNEKDCANVWSGASYATSSVEIANAKLLSWDQGWNDMGEQVWGAENGPYVFLKDQ